MASTSTMSKHLELESTWINLQSSSRKAGPIHNLIHMKMQLNIILTLVVLLLTSGTAKAQLGQESRVATTAAPFLTLGVGAKGTSLGHANTVYVSGAEALFWNPAGISVRNEGDSYASTFISISEYFVDVNIYGNEIHPLYHLGHRLVH